MSDKIDFMQMVDCIFKNKHLYARCTDEDKINNFFMVNRKFAVKYYKQAQYFNTKFVDKASALDLWFNFFQKTPSTPGWYWAKSPTKKEKTSKITKADRELFLHNEHLSAEDYEFLMTHYPEDVEHEIKKLNRFEG